MVIAVDRGGIPIGQLMQMLAVVFGTGNDKPGQPDLFADLSRVRSINIFGVGCKAKR